MTECNIIVQYVALNFVHLYQSHWCLICISSDIVRGLGPGLTLLESFNGNVLFESTVEDRRYSRGPSAQWLAFGSFILFNEWQFHIAVQTAVHWVSIVVIFCHRMLSQCLASGMNGQNTTNWLMSRKFFTLFTFRLRFSSKQILHLSQTPMFGCCHSHRYSPVAINQLNWLYRAL